MLGGNAGAFAICKDGTELEGLANCDQGFDLCDYYGGGVICVGELQ